MELRTASLHWLWHLGQVCFLCSASHSELCFFVRNCVCIKLIIQVQAGSRESNQILVINFNNRNISEKCSKVAICDVNPFFLKAKPFF
jgi:hypothetical protein